MDEQQQHQGGAATAAPDAVRAVATATSVNTSDYGTSLHLQGVYSDDPTHPNKAFSDATPSLTVSMTIAPGKAAGAFFEQGAEYELVFRKRTS